VKICYICNEYPPARHGGIGSVTQTLARALADAGHTVRVAGLYPGGGAPGPERDGEVEVWRFAEPGWPGGWLAARAKLFRYVRRWCLEGAVDVVEVPDYQGPAAGWPRLPVPVVARAHGSGCFCASLANHLPKRLTAIIESASMRRADFWCAVSRFAADVSQRLFRLERAADAIVYNTVECGSGLSRPRSRSDVVFTGTLTATKGVVPLVRGWGAVAPRCPDAKLHLFGKDTPYEAGGSMRGHLESLLGATVRESVTFHGHVSRERVREALESARAAIFPSYGESFGLAPVEAMACGCPTIYSRRPAGPEIVRDNIDGLLVEPDHVEEIADTLVRLLRDDALAERLGRGGRDRAGQHFSLELGRRVNEDFYRDCIETFRSSAGGRSRAGRALPAAAEAGGVSK